MALYAQHGYGKSDKIDTALAEGTLRGVVLSPRDEKPDNLEAYIGSLRGQYGDAVQIMVDPQFYASTITPARDGNLPYYDYYKAGLTRRSFIANNDIANYVAGVLQHQTSLDVSRVLSPTVFVNAFNDPWSQISLSLALETIDAHSKLNDAAPLLLSVVIDEAALRDQSAVEEFLDIVSVWQPHGYYILVRFSDQRYPCQLDEVVLSNLMYLVYALAEVNGFEVICGFSDFVGVLMSAVGATANCAGWHNSLRQFSLKRFQPATGGKQPRSRFSSARLLNSILIIPELDTIYQQGLLNQVLTGTAYEQAVANGPADAPWPRATECLHHWAVLQSLDAGIAAVPGVAARLDFATQQVQQAVGLYAILDQAGIPFQQETGPRNLDVWRRAIRAFRTDAGI